MNWNIVAEKVGGIQNAIAKIYKNKNGQTLNYSELIEKKHKLNIVRISIALPSNRKFKIALQQKYT